MMKKNLVGPDNGWSSSAGSISSDQRSVSVMTARQNSPAEAEAAQTSDLLDFDYLSSPAMQELIQTDFGIDCSKLSLPTQFRFLQFLKRKRVNEIEPVKEFTHQFGENGLECFLALEYREDLSFLETLSEKLTDSGIAIDDSVRDNDGYYYRLAERLELKEKLSQPPEHESVPSLFIVTCPGFPGEDYRQDTVPLAFVLAHDSRHVLELQKHLQPGSALRTLEDMAQNSEYLRSLDRTGLTARRVEEVLRRQTIVLERDLERAA